MAITAVGLNVSLGSERPTDDERTEVASPSADVADQGDDDVPVTAMPWFRSPSEDGEDDTNGDGSARRSSVSANLV